MRQGKVNKTLEDKLHEFGFIISDTSYNCILAENEFFFLRHYRNSTIELAVKSNFDRWGNSVDFEFKMPKSDRSWNKIYYACLKDVLLGRCGYYEEIQNKPRYVNRRLFRRG